MFVAAGRGVAATAVRGQATGFDEAQWIEDDHARVRRIDAAMHDDNLEKRGEVSAGLGGIQGAVSALGGQGETGGAPTDAPRDSAVQCYWTIRDLRDLRTRT